MHFNMIYELFNTLLNNINLMLLNKGVMYKYFAALYIIFCHNVFIQYYDEVYKQHMRMSLHVSLIVHTHDDRI